MESKHALRSRCTGTYRQDLVGSTHLLPLRMFLAAVMLLFALGGEQSRAQGVGISESSITPDASAILELRSSSRGFLLPRLASGSISSPVQGLLIYNSSSNVLNFHNGTSWLPLVSTADNLSVFAPTTSAQLAGVLSDETGTGLAVFSNSPTFVTPTLGAATATSINNVTITQPATSATLTLADNSSLITAGAFSTTLTSTGVTNVTLPTSGTLATIGVLTAVQVFTANGTYTPSGDVKSFVVYAIGGGGGGGGCPNTAGATGAGGGAGGTAIKVYTNPLASSYSYTIGAAGTGVVNANGTAGGATTFDVLTANGGGGGTVGLGTTGSPRTGGTGGTATGGDINITGMAGGAGVRLAATNGYGLAGNGGSTVFGSGGAGHSGGTAGNGLAGTGYGSGGGGSIGNTARAGGNGAPGVVVVFEYK